MTRRVTNTNFTEAQVARIKRNLLLGFSARELAQANGCALETIRKIGRGDTWAWVEAEAAEAPAELPPAPLPSAIAESQARLKRLLAEAQEVKEVDEELERMRRKTPYY
jgi:hypothetical protein